MVLLLPQCNFKSITSNLSQFEVANSEIVDSNTCWFIRGTGGVRDQYEFFNLSSHLGCFVSDR